MKKIKISELPLYSSLKGLFTIGTDANNRSVKVSLEFVEQQTTQAVTNAKEATDAANTAAAAANTAKKNADTATAAAKTATTNAIKAKEDADEATKKANAATDAANKAIEDCDTATEDAQEATTAANEATAAAQEATEDAVNATDNVLLTLGRLVPTGMTVESVTRLTVGNVKPNYIKAALSPASAMQNVIFISDNKAITVGTDGRITVVGRGKSTVHVIPTCNTALAKTLLIEVVAPALRKATYSSLRLTQSGALRFG
jgi:hypothetical protein